LDDEQIIICPSHSIREVVILQPDAGVGFAVVFGDVAQCPKASRKMGVVHGASEYLGTSPFWAEAASLVIVAAPAMGVSHVWLGMHAVTPWAMPLVRRSFRSGIRLTRAVTSRKAFQ
jgi:hypothetical protein